MATPYIGLVVHAGSEEKAIVGGDRCEAGALQVRRASLQSGLAAVAGVYQVNFCNSATLQFSIKRLFIDV